MTITQAMRDFVKDNINRPYEVVIEDFLDEYYDEGANEDVFSEIWKTATNLEPARNQANQPKEDHKTAPFRFVSLNETIAMPEDCIAAAWDNQELHSRPLANGLSGSFKIKVTFDGPVLVGGTDQDSPQTLAGEYVLPASTLRGLTRAVVETAAFGRLTQTNLHHRYGIRDFSHDLFNDEARKEVKAGWLRPWQEGDPKTDSGYVIAVCDWETIKIRELNGEASDNADWHHSWLTKSIVNRYAQFGMRKNSTFDFHKTHNFVLTPDNGFRIDANGNREGVLVFSDRSPAFSGAGLGRDDKETLRDRHTDKAVKVELQKAALDIQDGGKIKGASKRTEAIFFETGQPAIRVSDALWKIFTRNNSTPSDHKPKPNGNWKVLKPTLDAGNRIPVFWVGTADKVSDFGLVRVFKRAHKNSVKDALKRTHPDHLIDPDNISPDFTDALFGFVHKPTENRKTQDEADRESQAGAHLKRHLKGRVAFGYAYLNKNTLAKVTKPVSTVMSAPRPSYGPFYLTGGRADWSDDNSRLAGRKRYPVRGADQNMVTRWLNLQTGKGNQALLSHLKFLTPQASAPLEFDAEIRVHNVTLAELGALIWALTWGGDPGKRHLIGRAKTAGAGQAAITVSGLEGLNFHLGAAPPNRDQALQAFAGHMKEQVAGWPKVEVVKELLNSADPAYGKRLKLEYLPLTDHGKLRKVVYENPNNAKLLGLK